MPEPVVPEPVGTGPGAERRSLWPSAPLGWVALGAAAVGLGSWIVLPIITSVFGERYPVTDSYVMPVIGTVLIVAGAIVNVIALWPGRQRSIMNIIATALIVPQALFFTFIVVGEGIAGM